jgi:hypothetical protein
VRAKNLPVCLSTPLSAPSRSMVVFTIFSDLTKCESFSGSITSKLKALAVSSPKELRNKMGLENKSEVEDDEAILGETIDDEETRAGDVARIAALLRLVVGRCLFEGLVVGESSSEEVT